MKRLLVLRNRQIVRLSVGTALLAVSIGCATYQNKVSDARQLLDSNPQEAVAKLEPLAQTQDKDQLVYKLDYAVALHQAKRYKESAKAFSEAEEIADIQDYVSLSKNVASLLTSEEMIQYKGDDFEKLMINAMNAINFLAMNDTESALVEVRRLNTKIYKYRTEAKRTYEDNPFAYYLSGAIWEADRKYDDAYIDYKKAAALLPNYTAVREDLVRTALLSGRPEDAQEYMKRWPEIKVKPEWKSKSMGELIVIYQQGWGPRKQPRPETYRFPMLVPVSTMTQSAKVEIEGYQPSIVTSRIYSVQDNAIKVMEANYSMLVASRVAGIVAKEVVADQIRQRNPLLGLVADVAMHASDRADLRQWSTLPASFQMARIPLQAGTYKFHVRGLRWDGSEGGEVSPTQTIEIKPGKKQFYTWRSFQ